MRPVLSQLHRSLLAWLLVFATLAAAVLPPFVHAHMHEHGTHTCDHFGIRLVQVPQLLGDVVPDSSETHLEHCPFCMHHVVPGFPTVLTFQHDVNDVRTAFVPLLYLFAHDTLFAWLIPSSRAPPLSLS